MKKYVKLIIYASGIIGIAIAATFAIVTSKHNKSLKKQVDLQYEIIDSLIANRTFMEVELFVTDKSKNTIYGRYNKGTIYMPQKRIYVLQLDSNNVKVRK